MAEETFNDTGILLESGTNELELLEFVVGNQHYGINVAKIRELCPYQPPTLVPNAHEYIEGIFMPRDMLMTVVDLSKALGLPPTGDMSGDMYIITNFNRLHTAFHVQKVLGIHRVSWEDIAKPDSTIAASGKGVATGIAKVAGKIIIVLDFEKIVAEIAPETTIQLSEVDQMGDRPICTKPLVIAEDSILLQKMIDEALERAGFTNVKNFNNGQEAWDYLHSISGDSDLYEKVNLIITDIEMPKMDGHRLTKLVKDDSRLKLLPVVIFSSLIDDQMRIKGEQLGADEQLTKPEIGNLVHVIDRLLERFEENLKNNED